MNSKTERLSVNLLRRDKCALERLANREGEAMAVVVRRLIRNAVREHRQPPRELDPAGEEQADESRG